MTGIEENTGEMFGKFTRELGEAVNDTAVFIKALNQALLDLGAPESLIFKTIGRGNFDIAVTDRTKNVRATSVLYGQDLEENRKKEKFGLWAAWDHLHSPLLSVAKRLATEANKLGFCLEVTQEEGKPPLYIPFENLHSALQYRSEGDTPRTNEASIFLSRDVEGRGPEGKFILPEGTVLFQVSNLKYNKTMAPGFRIVDKDGAEVSVELCHPLFFLHAQGTKGFNLKGKNSFDRVAAAELGVDDAHAANNAQIALIEALHIQYGYDPLPNFSRLYLNAMELFFKQKEVLDRGYLTALLIIGLGTQEGMNTYLYDYAKTYSRCSLGFPDAPALLAQAGQLWTQLYDSPEAISPLADNRYGPKDGIYIFTAPDRYILQRQYMIEKYQKNFRAFEDKFYENLITMGRIGGSGLMCAAAKLEANIDGLTRMEEYIYPVKNLTISSTLPNAIKTLRAAGLALCDNSTSVPAPAELQAAAQSIENISHLASTVTSFLPPNHTYRIRMERDGINFSRKLIAHNKNTGLSDFFAALKHHNYDLSALRTEMDGVPFGQEETKEEGKENRNSHSWQQRTKDSANSPSGPSCPFAPK